MAGIKILHTADLHLDSPFDALPEEKAAQRRAEQRSLLNSIADLAESEKADVVLMSGDLLDSALSYYETYETLYKALSRISGRVFIAPGNHDCVTSGSPYIQREFPENVHIFRSPHISCVEIPELGCRVYGAGFVTPRPLPMLHGFRAEPDDIVNIMVMHGDLYGQDYNHIDTADIAGSNLDYLALGHIHTFSGINKAGGTFYAYPGCPEGRGFDETGEKGVIAGTVSNGSCDLRFVPIEGRRYRIIEVPMDDAEDVYTAAKERVSPDMRGDVARIVLTGETETPPDIKALEREMEGYFFHVTVRDETRPRTDIWEGISEDTLRAGFLRFMKRRYDMPGADTGLIEKAVRYGLAALDNREEWRP